MNRQSCFDLGEKQWLADRWSPEKDILWALQRVRPRVIEDVQKIVCDYCGREVISGDLCSCDGEGDR